MVWVYHCLQGIVLVQGVWVGQFVANFSFVVIVVLLNSAFVGIWYFGLLFTTKTRKNPSNLWAAVESCGRVWEAVRNWGFLRASTLCRFLQETSDDG